MPLAYGQGRMCKVSNDLRVRVWQHCMGGFDWPCVICGGSHEQDHVAATLMQGDHEKIGDVCPACLDAGPVGAAQNMRNYAEALVQRAAELFQFSSEVSQIPVKEWATSKDVERVHAEWEAIRFADDVPAESREGVL